MGTSLASATPSASFDSLIKFGDNDAVTSIPKQLSDGLGNNLPIYVSSTTVNITGSMYGTVTTASYVQTAQTASYVKNAQTASYVQNAQTASLAATASYLILNNVPEYPDNNEAINIGGLPIGAVYRISGGDILAIVHS